MTYFSSGDSLGNMPPGAIAAYLMEVGNLDDARHFQQGAISGQSFLSLKKPYSHSGFILGFIPEATRGAANTGTILGTSQIEGDKALVGTRIKVSLDKFYVCNYPGLGQHTVLCEFAGKNQVPGETEELRFALRFQNNDRASAAVSGVPIFMGVTVGEDGISFEGRTINVSSSLDDVILSTLDTPAFKNGLALLANAQPALKPFSSLAAAAVSTTLKRKQNKQVHNFNLGLDFAKGASSARLRLGSYVVVQSDDVAGWNWDNFEWNRDTHMIEFKANKADPVPFNFMVFGVARFSDK